MKPISTLTGKKRSSLSTINSTLPLYGTILSSMLVAACSSQSLTPKSTTDFSYTNPETTLSSDDTYQQPSAGKDTPENDELLTYGLEKSPSTNGNDSNEAIGNFADSIQLTNMTKSNKKNEVDSLDSDTPTPDSHELISSTKADNYTSTTEGTDMTVLVLDEETAEALEASYIARQERAIIEPPQPRIIFFPFDKSSLTSEDMSAIKQHADFLAVHADYRVQIHGHTDAQGHPTYNEQLSIKRAQNIAEELKAAGVREEQIEVFGWGSDEPLLRAAQHEKNRRVELIYLTDQIAKDKELESENNWEKELAKSF